MPVQHNSQYRLSRLNGEFISKAAEREFTVNHWPIIARQLRLSSAIGAVAYPVAFSVDYLTFGWGRAALVMVAMRLAVALVAALIFFSSSPKDFFSNRTKSLIFLSELLLGISELIEYRFFSQQTNSSQAVGTPFIVVFILIFYVVIPNRAYLTVIASFMVSILFLGYQCITLSPFYSIIAGLGVSLLAVNAFGYTVLLMSNRCSRHTFREHILLNKEISERKMAEVEANQARIAAEQANLAKSRFLSVMNHELRTPLNGVLGGIQLLEGTAPDPKQHKIIQMINRSGDQLNALISDVLDLARIESGQIQLTSESFSLRKLLDDLEAIMTMQAREKGLGFKLKLDDGLPSVLQGDPTRLRQVLINLAGNAIKFTDTNEVSIMVKVESPDSTPVRLTFFVIDNGTGISDAEQKRIFDPFYQTDSSDTRNHGGSGLGLSISRELVVAMGGELQVASGNGIGSRFYFTLEFILGAEDAMTATLDDLPQLSLLLVDDADANRWVAGSLLEELGQLVTYAASGEQAISLGTAYRFDLILMDLHMPGINGIEAAQRIHAVYPNVPIVAMTADTVKEKIQSCQDEGMAGFIPKPIRREQLLECLLKLSGRHNIQDDKKSHGPGPVAADEVCPLLDMELVLDIKEHLSKQKIAQIMTICRHSLRDILTPNKQGQKGGGASLDSARVHCLAGIAGNYGMMRLHQCIRKLKMALATSDHEQQRILEQEVRQLTEISLKKLNQTLKSFPPVPIDSHKIE